jgi:hypothetical protein
VTHTVAWHIFFCRDEVCRITVYVAGGRRLKMRTSEPRDRALWTLAASVPQAGTITVRGRVIVATRTRTRLIVLCCKGP